MSRVSGIGADDDVSLGFRAALDGLRWDADAVLRSTEPVGPAVSDPLVTELVDAGWAGLGDVDGDLAVAVRCAWHAGHRPNPLPVPLLEMWLGAFALSAIGAGPSNGAGGTGSAPSTGTVPLLSASDAIDGAVAVDGVVTSGPVPLSAPAMGSVLSRRPVEGTQDEAWIISAERQALSSSPAPTLDTTLSTAMLSAPEGRWSILGRLDAGRAGELERRALLLSAGEMLGTADSLFEQMIDYLRERRQFGVPIGSFQALKHRAVDLQAELLSAKALVRLGVDAPDEHRDDVLGVARLAFASAGEAALRAGSEAVQMHGGYGFTWEAGLHLGFRRIVVRAGAGGGPAAAWLRAGEWVRDRDEAYWPLGAV